MHWLAKLGALSDEGMVISVCLQSHSPYPNPWMHYRGELEHHLFQARNHAGSQCFRREMKTSQVRSEQATLVN